LIGGCLTLSGKYLKHISRPEKVQQYLQKLEAQWAEPVLLTFKHGYHRNLVGSIYGMSSMKNAQFVPIGLQA
jgi:hypothetical protein